MTFHDDYDNGMDSRYSLPFHRQGIPTSPQTPVQLQEMAQSLNMGVKSVEVGTISQDTFENIPEQHFGEMHRLAKLSDSKVTMHAPIIDPAGFDQQGKWTEQNRKSTERYINTVLDRAHKLDPKGNIPIALHTTAAMLPGTRKSKGEDGIERTESILAMNRETGQSTDLHIKEKYNLTGKKSKYTPESQLKSINITQWDERKLDVASSQRLFRDVEGKKERIMNDSDYMTLRILEKDKNISEDQKTKLNHYEKDIEILHNQSQQFNEDMMLKLNNMYDDLKKYKPIKEKEEDYKKDIETMNNLSKNYKENPRKYHESPGLIFNELSKISTSPNMWITSEEFHKEKVSDTVAENALHAYSKYGDTAPIVALENVYGDNVLSRAETMKDAIIESRKKITKGLIAKGTNKSEAKKIADKLVGATWDVGHINMLRKQGYGKKDIIAEAKKIAPYVKHVHISDNFGYTDAHLPPGMGSSPIKEQLKEIDKFARDATHVVEAGAYAGQFKDNPVPYILENLDTPLYSHGASPNWADIRNTYESYMVGLGDVLPDRYFGEFGAGFARLPKELGGQLGGGDRSKFAGTPNQ